MNAEERRREVMRVMRARLDQLARYMEAENIGERVARVIAQNVTGSAGMSLAEIRGARHSEVQRVEWAGVLEHGWIVTHNEHDPRWLEARRGDRVVRAVTFSDLCLQMAAASDYRADEENY